MLVFSQNYCALAPRVTVFRGGTFWSSLDNEGRTLMNGISSLIKEAKGNVMST